MASPTKFWTFLAAVAAAMAMVLAHGAQELSQEKVAIGKQEKKAAELRHLRSEQTRLISIQESGEYRAHRETNRAETAKLRARLAELNKDLIAERFGAGANRSFEKIPESAWYFAGNADPKSTVESLLWSASRGDVDRLSTLLDFAPDVRTNAEVLFSQLPTESQQTYGTPEKVIATLLAGSFPNNASEMSIEGDFQTSEGRVVSLILKRADGPLRFNQLSVSQTPAGWRVLVPSAVLADYAKMLGGPQEDATSP